MGSEGTSIKTILCWLTDPYLLYFVFNFQMSVVLSDSRWSTVTLCSSWYNGKQMEMGYGYVSKVLISSSHIFIHPTHVCTHSHTHICTHTHTRMHTHTRTYTTSDLTALHSSHLLSCNFNPKSTSEKQLTETVTHAENMVQDAEHESRTDDVSSSYVHRKLSLTVTAFAWLPALVKTEFDGKLANLALVAMATRLGHVVLMVVEVPLVDDR